MGNKPTISPAVNQSTINFLKRVSESEENIVRVKKTYVRMLTLPEWKSLRKKQMIIWR